MANFMGKYEIIAQIVPKMTNAEGLYNKKVILVTGMTFMG